ncbi:MAG: hypothetical protein AAGI09_13595 [Pseudomonadota bacterium]
MRVVTAFIGLSAIGLSACSEVLVYDQPGVTVSRLASDLERCTLRAEAVAPREIQRQRRTVRVVDYYYGLPGYGYDRAWVDVDINAVTREEYRLDCLEDAGYSLSQVTVCEPGRSSEVTPATKQVAAGETSCAVTIADVGPVILPGS